MSNSVTRSSLAQSSRPRWRPSRSRCRGQRPPDAKQGLVELMVSTGLQVFEAMLEQDRDALCGAKWKRCPERRAAGGTHAGRGDARWTADRDAPPRARSGPRASSCCRASRSRRIATRSTPARWRRSRAASRPRLPRSSTPCRESGERSVSRSAVSRRFVALSTEQLREWTTRPLGDLDLRVVLIDGILFRDHVILIALGVDADGKKHVLGLREGTTENATVVRAARRPDRARLSAEQPMLFVIDGAKALRKAIRRSSATRRSSSAARCTSSATSSSTCPRTDAAERAPRDAAAYETEDAALAERQLERSPARSSAHPGAAASLLEGLDETLTLQRLGIRARSTGRCAARTRSRT